MKPSTENNAVDLSWGSRLAIRWAALASELRNRAQSSLGDDGQIISPDTKLMSDRDRAEIYLHVLESVYRGAHRRSALNIDQVTQLQAAGRLKIWVVLWGDDPVGITTFTIGADGVATSGVTAKLPSGTRLRSGRAFVRQLRVAAAVCFAFADILTDANLLSQLWCLSGEIRLAADRALPNGELIKAGAPVHRTVDACGLVPYLYTAPYPNLKWAEFFLWSRLYLAPEAVDHGPFFIPVEAGASCSLRHLVAASYRKACGVVPEFKDSHGDQGLATSIVRSDVFGEGVVTLIAEGSLGPEDLRRAIDAALAERPFCKVATPNHPGNADLQRHLVNLGLVPLGIWPGGEFPTDAGDVTVRTLLVYAAGRAEALAATSSISLGSCYLDSEIGQLVIALYDRWRAIGGLKEKKA